jgi:hypothetical protein
VTGDGSQHPAITKTGGVLCGQPRYSESLHVAIARIPAAPDDEPAITGPTPPGTVLQPGDVGYEPPATSDKGDSGKGRRPQKAP